MARKLSKHPPRGPMQLWLKGDESGPLSAECHYTVDNGEGMIEKPKIKKEESLNCNQSMNGLWNSSFAGIKSDESI